MSDTQETSKLTNTSQDNSQTTNKTSGEPPKPSEAPAMPAHIPAEWWLLPADSSLRREASEFLLNHPQENPQLISEVARVRLQVEKKPVAAAPMKRIGGGSFLADLRRSGRTGAGERFAAALVPKPWTAADARAEAVEVERQRKLYVAQEKRKAGVPAKFISVTPSYTDRGTPWVVNEDNKAVFDMIKRVGQDYVPGMVFNPEAEESDRRIGVILQGNNGCGKSMLCCLLLARIIDANSKRWGKYELALRAWKRAGDIEAPKPFLPIEHKARIINVSTWIQLYRSTYYGAGKDGVPTQAQVLDLVHKPHLLIVDDIRAKDFPVGDKGNTARSHLSEIIDFRNERMMNTVYTTNITLDQFARALDGSEHNEDYSGANYSRIMGDCYFASAGKHDYRQAPGGEE